MRRTVTTISIIIVLFALVYVYNAFRYPLGSGTRPGSGLYPLIVGLLLLFFAIATAAEAVLKSSSGEINWPDRTGWRRVGTILAATIGYIALLPYLGYALVTTGVSLVVLQVMGMAGWIRKIGVALLFGVGSYLLFAVALGMPLPGGMLLR